MLNQYIKLMFWNVLKACRREHLFFGIEISFPFLSIKKEIAWNWDILLTRLSNVNEYEVIWGCNSVHWPPHILSLTLQYSIDNNSLLIFTVLVQGIWLCEHRDHPTARKVVVTLNGIWGASIWLLCVCNLRWCCGRLSCLFHILTGHTCLVMFLDSAFWWLWAY